MLRKEKGFLLMSLKEESDNEVEAIQLNRVTRLESPTEAEVVDGPRTPETPDGKPVPRDGSVTSSDETPLIRAVRHGSSSTFSFLTNELPSSVCIADTDRYERNAFHYAITKPDVLKALLETFQKDTFVNETLRQEDKEGKTPIHRAASLGNAKSLEILHEYDTSLIKLRTKFTKSSVLHCAVRSNSVMAVQFISRQDPKQLTGVDSMLRTPVHHAAKLKQRDIMAHLVSKGADTMAQNSTSLVSRAWMTGGRSFSRPQFTWNRLRKAMAKYSMMQERLTFLAVMVNEYDIADANGQVAIHAAASRGLLNMVELLVGEDPDCIDQADSTGQTALILAARNGFSLVVLYLLNHDADYRIKDHKGSTALDWAIKARRSDVVDVFLDRDYWKEVIIASSLGPETCLARLVESMPETAKKLLDKCVTVKGTKDDPDSYQVLYDFFCLEHIGENQCPQFEAISSMLESERTSFLSHPMSVKYINVKWSRRAFKFNLAALLVALVFHVCIMVFTTKVCAIVTEVTEYRMSGGRRLLRKSREWRGARPDKDWMLALRVVMLFIIFGTILKELYQVAVQRLKYFLEPTHYVQWLLCITVVFYLLTVDDKLSPSQLGSGSIAVLLSWTTLIQFLRTVPVVGVYILAVTTVLWTLIKIFVVVLIFLLSFSTTFYILLAEHESFSNLGISLVSTFIGMMSGVNYDSLFVEEGWYPKLYSLKFAVLVSFVLVMSIVVNNTLIGLAVGDIDRVMKTAKFEKFRRKALFVIHLERSVSRLPGFNMLHDECLTEFPKRNKKGCDAVWDLLYFGGKLDKVDGGWNDETDAEEDVKDFEATLEDHLDKILTVKVESLRSSIQHELAEVLIKMGNDQKKDMESRRGLEQKLDKILERLTS